MSDHCLGRGRCVGEKNSFRSPDETVNYGEEMGVTSSWWERTYQIDIDVAKTTLRDTESLKWCFDVTLDLGSLARDAGFNPDTHLFL